MFKIGPLKWNTRINFNAEGGAPGAPAAPPAAPAAPPAAPAAPAAPAPAAPAPAAPAAPAAAPPANAPWWGSIKEEPVRALMETKAYESPEALAYAYYNANKMLNGAGDVVALPGEGATEQDWDQFYTRMGRPADVSGYEFKFGEDVQTDDRMVEFGKKLFHKMGLNNAQAQQAADLWNEFIAGYNSDNAKSVSDAQLEVAQQNEQKLNALTEQWKKDGGLNENLEAGRRVVQALGLSDDALSAIEANLGSAETVELMAKIGLKSQEGGFKSGTPTGDPSDPSNMTKEQAQAEINRLSADPAFQTMYGDPQAPGHKDAVAKMERLFSRL